MDNLVEVTVLVPRDKLAKFYMLHGRFLKERGMHGGPGGERGFGERRGPEFGGRHGRPGGEHGFGFGGPQRAFLGTPAQRVAIWAEGSDEERLADAKEYYSTLSETARKFLDLLLDDERSEIPSEELIEKLGLESNRVLAGSLSSFGRKARRIGRWQPFGFETKADGTTVYSVPTEIAELFRTARG